MNHDYTIQIIASQRQQDLLAEAANERLVRLARGDRAPWWKRLLAPATSGPATQPIRHGRLATHHGR